MEQQEKQERITTLNELITGLSRQVLQVASAAESSGHNFQPGNSTFSRLSKLEFPPLMGMKFRVGCINANSFLKLIILMILQRLR